LRFRASIQVTTSWSRVASMQHLTKTDHMHVLRKRLCHRIVARVLRNEERGETLFQRAHDALEGMEARFGSTPFVVDWRGIMAQDRDFVAKRIVQMDEKMDSLRDSSPFLKIWGYDFGFRMPLRTRQCAHDFGTVAKGWWQRQAGSRLWSVTVR
jgi:hypothetical protein